MDYRARVEKILESVNGDLGKAVAEILDGSADLIRYVVEIGLLTFQRRQRADTRKHIRTTVLNPQFVKGRVTGSIRRSKRAQARIDQAVRSLFIDWKIGKIALGDVSKSGLLEAAASERGSSKGHLRNAYFYEALAEPMNDKETVKEHWKDSKAAALIRDEIWRDSEDKPVVFGKAA